MHYLSQCLLNYLLQLARKVLQNNGARYRHVAIIKVNHYNIRL
jgi:hypothetical protein